MATDFPALGQKGPAQPWRDQLKAYIDERDTPVAASFVTLGDSRMGYNGPVTQANPGETAVYTSDRGIVSQAQVMTRHRLKWLRNGGVGGNTVAQMRDRVDALLDTYKPGVLIGFGHVNSLGVSGITAAAITADLAHIFEACAKRGVVVVWGTDWVGSSSNTAQRAISYAVNDWLRRQVGARRGFRLVEYQAVMVDPTTGNPLAAYASDGLHQDGLGPRALAGQLAPVMESLAPRSDRLIASNDDPINLVPNGMLVGASGAGMATGWSAGGTTTQAVASKVARTDGFPGDWQQLVYTSATNYIFYRRVGAGVTWQPGQTVYGECEFETDADGWNVSEMNLNVNLYDATQGAVIRAADLLHVNGAPASPGRIASGILRTPPITIGAANTNIDLSFILKGSGTVRLGRMALKAV